VHFKLLNHLHYDKLVNVPNFLYNMFKRMASEYQKKKSHTTLSHHCLISLLIKRSLRIQHPQVDWEVFQHYVDITTLLEQPEAEDEPQHEPKPKIDFEQEGP